VILLVDATQGVQAQTLSVLKMAEDLGLVIIPVLSKIDSLNARVDEIKAELAELISCSGEDVLSVSGKTGEGVETLFEKIVEKIPSPTKELEDTEGTRALVFDFEYSNHKGIVIYVRVLDGTIRKNEELLFVQGKEKFKALDVGTFSPDPVSSGELKHGEIGYIVTGIKKAGVASVGETVTQAKNPLPVLSGYQHPRPVVWASVYPESQDDFALLKSALEKLKLTDPSLSFEEESSGTLGRGFRCGFLGMLHLEIITERLKREFTLVLVVATPSITYTVEYKSGKKEIVYSPSLFPDHGTYEKVHEPWVKLNIMCPGEYMGGVMQLMYEHEAEVGHSETFGDNRMTLEADMPLRELMRNFFDELKSVSSGFASLSYEIVEDREADVARLDVLVAEEVMPAFSRVVAKRRIEEDAKSAVEKLHSILPRQQFVIKIQGRALGRIIASKTLSAYRKDVTAKLYGGDVTRKMKLLEKQKKGKKKMRASGKVNIPQDVFLKMMK